MVRVSSDTVVNPFFWEEVCYIVRRVGAVEPRRLSFQWPLLLAVLEYHLVTMFMCYQFNI